MKKLLLLALFAAGSMNAQTTLFEDSFDTYTDFAIANVGAWTLVDVDLLPTYGFNAPTVFENDFVAKSFQVFNSTATTPPLTGSATSNWTARTGAKAMACFAAVPDTEGGPTQNDDWLISPQITLAATGNELSFWAKSCDTTFGNEIFNVLISTTGTNPDDFFAIADNVASPADITYYEYLYSLDDFAGETVYIAIQCISADQFGFMVDDFKVTTTELGVGSVFSRNFVTYPNPASDVLNIDSKNGVEMESVRIFDLNGRTVQSQNVQGENVQLNLSALSSGAYFLEVQSSAGTATQKIIRK